MRTGIILLAWTLSMAAVAQEEEAVSGAPAVEDVDAEEPVITDAPAVPAEESGAIYRSVGEDGSVVFSDTPSPGAEKVDIREMQSIEAPPPPPIVYERPQAPPERYQSVLIVEPADDAEIRENTGNMTISVAIEPGLQSPDQVAILIDGQEAAAGPQTSFTLGNVDRGTHRLTAVVRGRDGRELASSPPVTFHMLRFHQPPPKATPPPAPAKPK
jgi:hypothetical protein